MRDKKRTVSLPVQMLALKKLFPESTAKIQCGLLVWQGNLRPSPLSRSYKVRILYRLTETPAVEVVEPTLEDRLGEAPPHMYPGRRPCLYSPKRFEWNESMRLSETIVPWLSEWLLFYEIWHATGEWCGGGEHPTVKVDRDALAVH